MPTCQYGKIAYINLRCGTIFPIDILRNLLYTVFILDSLKEVTEVQMFAIVDKCAKFFSDEPIAVRLEGQDKFYGNYIAVRCSARDSVQVFFTDSQKGFEHKNGCTWRVY